MSNVLTPEDTKFPRVNTRVTKEALARLNYACALRERNEPRTCPQGTIISELVMEHLAEVPEGYETNHLPQKKEPKKAKRGRPPKSAVA